MKYSKTSKNSANTTIKHLLVMAFTMWVVSCGEEKVDGVSAEKSDAADDQGRSIEASASMNGDGDPVAADEPQAIVLHRAVKVGDKYHLSSEGRSKEAMELSMNGEVVPSKSQSKDFSAKIEVDVEVGAVNESGEPKAATLQVITLTRSDDGAAESSLLNNVKVEAISTDGAVSYSVDGTLVEEKVAETLELFSMVETREISVNDDSMFGTDEPRKPGDEWEVNGSEIAESLSKEGDMDISSESVNGTMKFENLVEIGGVPCQKVSGTITMNLSTFPGLPADAKVSNSTMTIGWSGAFPTVPTLQPVEESMTMQVSPTIAFSAQGKSFEMKIDSFESKTSKFTNK
ncbi:hypothetical protein N9292_04920 [Akkermansiaceae bacterium]|nr:hypothetical protein [Akkermansiaceae bacterium]MDB4424767.1 hypothetical protein [Akkermansiaceae bacterium]